MSKFPGSDLGILTCIYIDSMYCRQDMPVGGGGGAGASQSRLVLGMFSIYPAFGYILPGAQQTITVDCIAEIPGRCEEVSENHGFK